MVAASGSKEGLKPWVAWTCLGVVIAGIGAAAVLGGQALLFRRVPIENPPEVMAAKAREILQKAGYPESPVDSALGFYVDEEYFQYVRRNDHSAGRWDRMPSSVIGFWYRQSPRSLFRWVGTSVVGGIARGDPPLSISGESLVTLDARGKLTSLHVIPPQRDESTGSPETPDWAMLFEASGLEPAKWTSAAPNWTPLLYGDTRAAWTGVLPDRPDVPMRIEAAAYHGKPVFWLLIAPWDNPSRMALSGPSLAYQVQSLLFVVLLFALVVGAAFFARRNMRLGRGDRRGAARLAYLAFTLVAFAWILREHHVPGFEEIELFFQFLSSALLVTGFLWLLYIALEPFVRRRWPGSLISWSRLFAGGFGDPLVGRDLLAGCVMGVVFIILEYLNYSLASWLGVPVDPPISWSLNLFLGTRATLGQISLVAVLSVFWGLAALFLLFLLQVLLRRKWIAAALFIMVWTAFFSQVSDSPLTWIVGALEWGATYFVLMRFGLLAVTAALMFAIPLYIFPITPQLSAWYSGIGLAGVVLLLAFAAYAFHTSLGGRPMFQARLLED
jgi:serine/threonine-protein kinase